MKRNYLKSVYKIALACCVVATCSCKKALDLKPKDQVDVTNAYQNVYDANAAVIGIYGQLLGIADRYIVLNELRADLMSPTANADQYLKQLNEHSETTDNPWVDPKPWYKIILNINDAMYHFTDMYQNGKLKATEYQERYSDLGSLRCWLYLQLGAHYGSVPYVTDPLASIDDLKDQSKYPKMAFSDILKKLATFMNDPARSLETYSASDPITGATNSALNTTIDGNSTSLFFALKYAIKGDVNLWAGNYKDASTAYKYLMEYGAQRAGFSDAAAQKYWYYKVCNDVFTISYTNNSDNQFVDGTTAGYREIFANATGTNIGSEHLWRMPFSTTFGPANPFINLFSNQGGSYLLTASKALINNWNSQVQNNGFPYDGRSRVAVRTINGQPVIMKQLYFYLNGTTFLPNSLLSKQGYWLIYRTSMLQEHFAESALNDGQNKIAYSLLNVGIKNMYNPYAPSAPPSSYDVTNTEQTFLPAPYDFDARSGGPQGYHRDWYRECGTRTRANLVRLDTTIIQRPTDLENEIINDSGRELCFEGVRWGDLVRVALRRNDPSFLANKIGDKLVAEGNPNAEAVRKKLMTVSNWYLPFKL